VGGRLSRAGERAEMILSAAQGRGSRVGGGVRGRAPRVSAVPPPTCIRSRRCSSPHEREGLEPAPRPPPAPPEPGEVLVSAAGVITDIIELRSRRQMDALDAEHVWTPPLHRHAHSATAGEPAVLLLVRAHRLHQPQTITNTPAYAGCKSWVPLDQPLEMGDALAGAG